MCRAASVYFSGVPLIRAEMDLSTGQSNQRICGDGPLIFAAAQIGYYPSTKTKGSNARAGAIVPKPAFTNALGGSRIFEGKANCKLALPVLPTAPSPARSPIPAHRP
jgi:hypothetical protein